MPITVEHVTTKAGFAEVGRLAAEIWTQHYTPIIGAEQVEYMLSHFQSAVEIERQTNAEGYTYLIARDGCTTCGYAAARPEGDGIFLSKLYVRDSARRRGVGQSLLSGIRDIFPGKDAFVTLTVNKHNHASIQAYMRMGFVIDCMLAQDIGGGYIMDDYHMTRRLGTRLAVRQFGDLSVFELQRILRARDAVFADERHCRHGIDDADMFSAHIYYERDGRVAAYLRIVPPHIRDADCHMEGIFTAEGCRGLGLGLGLALEGVGYAKAHYPGVPMMVSAPTQARRFFEKAGFAAESGEYQEDNLPHIRMKYIGEEAHR